MLLLKNLKLLQTKWLIVDYKAQVSLKEKGEIPYLSYISFHQITTLSVPNYE